LPCTGTEEIKRYRKRPIKLRSHPGEKMLKGQEELLRKLSASTVVRLSSATASMVPKDPFSSTSS